MKSDLLTVLALSLLLSACQTQPNTSAHIDTSRAVSAGIKDTKWGPLPSYELAGHRFTNLSVPKLGTSDRMGALKLDLLINEDGSVRDVAVFEGSSNPDLDKAIAAAFMNALYSLKLSPEDPAPYVVRFTMQVRIASAGGSRSRGFADAASLGSLGPQPDYSGPPPATYSYSTSTP